ncbi:MULTISPECIES: glycosyltransferase [unclassified Brenneria]|uniref:glycosyltransferase n=1 Tax=unclassified Brenneria TaxID=2634434 RepID=UPI0029C3ECD2|nr:MULTISPECIES: glycosyltransferase [unclassified Brenneria]MDX5627792.1 glycosyltransferase [Brenneria sp. L3-3Z]MDX5695117.1 glycosyltransferase [Brenneria sp. L4-2C]
MIDVCAVIVTYGERIHLLKQVIERLLDEDVSSIVIVSNGQTTTQCNHLRTECSDKRINIIFNDCNEGSAGGYFYGIKFFLEQKKEEFLILLDDDNVIDQGGVKNIISYYLYNDNSDKIFCAHRKDRVNQVKSLSKGMNIIYSNNCFLGYDIFYFFKEKRSESDKYIYADILPYGGMVLKRNVVKHIGLPDKSFYLYSDDFEYSLRAKAKGYKLILIKNIAVTDIDVSWHVRKSGSVILDPNSNKERVYYTIRNGVVTDLRYNKNGFFYYVNFMYFIFIQIIKDLRGFKFNFLMLSNWKVFFKAYSDAIKNKLGKVDIQ